MGQINDRVDTIPLWKEQRHGNQRGARKEIVGSTLLRTAKGGMEKAMEEYALSFPMGLASIGR